MGIVRPAERPSIGCHTKGEQLPDPGAGNFAAIRTLIHSLPLLLLSLVCPCLAVDTWGQTSAQPAVAPAEVTRERPLFQLRYANDYFAATDYYFTQGIYASYGTSKLSFFAGQEGYTPTSIADPELRWGDRPYAGTLYVGVRGRFAERHQRPNQQWTYEALLGIIGPQAKGEEQQRSIHRFINDEAPMGWRYQIGNDVLADVSVGFRQNLVQRPHLSVDAEAEARLGTFRTRLSAGGEARFGWPFLAAFVAPQVLLPFHDATLQGGVFSESPYTLGYREVDPVVGRMDVGIQGRIGNWVIHYSRTFQTREIKAGRNHGWGALGVAVQVHSRKSAGSKERYALLQDPLSGRTHRW